MIARITAAYTRHYSDNGQRTVYVEWLDDKGHSGRTEGPASSVHMWELLNRAKRGGVIVKHEEW
jgi:hypothetical protein